MGPTRNGRKRRRKFDFGRALARVLCGLFALIGLLPILLAILVRTEGVQRWAAEETSTLIQRELGVQAAYSVHLSLWPLRVELSDVIVPANDGGEPVLRAERVAVTPRVFALLAGKLDVGEIEVDAPRIRAVVKDDKLTNLDYRLPESSGGGGGMKRAPFSNIAVSDATIDLRIDERRVKTGMMDIDIYAEKGPTFEVALRASEIVVIQQRNQIAEAGDEQDARPALSTLLDEDIVCQLNLRLRYASGELLVRRLSLLGAGDPDGRSGTEPSCRVSSVEKNPWQVALRLSQLRVRGLEAGQPTVNGHVFARAPLPVLNRYVGTNLKGWVGLSGDVRYDGSGKLPEFRGRVRAGQVKLDDFRIAETFDAEIELRDDVVKAPRVRVKWSDGDFDMRDVESSPLAKPPTLTVAHIDVKGVTFPGLMRDLAVTPNTIVGWDIDKITVTNLKGTLAPLAIDADMVGETSNFAVYDRAWHDPAKSPMLAAAGNAYLRMRMAIRPSSFEFRDARITVGNSKLNAPLVYLGFDNKFKLEVARSSLALDEISPLAGIPWGGVAELSAEMDGTFSNPVLTGLLEVHDFMFGGFEIADTLRARTRFAPLKLELTDIRARKNKSDLTSRSTRIAFDEGSTVVLDSEIASPNMNLRDFLAIWGFDQDPRFDPIFGQGSMQAQVHFDYGGPADRCKTGLLEVRGEGVFEELDLFDEPYDTGSATFRMRWFDRDAGIEGMDIDIPSASLTKGRGTMLASVRVRKGAELRGHALGTNVPLSKLRAMGMLADAVEGYGSGSVEVFGKLDAPAFDASINLSPVQIGGSVLPASSFGVKLRPIEKQKVTLGKTSCGGDISPEFDLAEYRRDEPQGLFHVSGKVFGGQVDLQGLEITQQREKVLRGVVELKDLDIGALSELVPQVAVAKERPHGNMSGTVHLVQLPMERPLDAAARIDLSGLTLGYGRGTIEVIGGETQPFELGGGKLHIPGLVIATQGPRGERAVVDLAGSVKDLDRAPNVDLALNLRPIDLSQLSLEGVDRAKGRIQGQLRAKGPIDKLVYSGGLALTGGELTLPDITLSRIEVAVEVDSDELKITRGSARMGNGTLQLGGSAKLRDLEVLGARAVITARNVSLPMERGLEASADSTLIATWKPGVKGDDKRSLPRITGTVDLKSFRYTRPVTMNADISALAQRGQRTEFESYDPEQDMVELDITIRSNRPLELSNNLLEADLEIDKSGLQLAGTNQRFGMRGDIKLKAGGRIQLRQHEFEIREGHVRFNDLTEIRPEVDVTAVTEYRRYSTASATSGTDSGGSSSATSGAAGGRWRIQMHAYGDAEELKIDLSSNPELAQDDIFLLLTIGLTRAELDQQQASVGESVALEALGTLTGADKAVTKAIPVIDDFRFGSAYSSRTGRTEPTVTIGKRLAERIRASVTSGVSDSREVRSNVEWRLNRRVSIEGSYDNVNDLTSSSLGNLGADIRWRMEFQ